jgi:nitrite reductase/ring-hydroxylating ferredoxin subunit
MKKPLDEAVRPGRGKLAEVDVSGLKSNGDAVTFEYVDVLGQEAEGFVMKWGGGFVAYENRCPHWSVPLGFGDDQFLDDTGSVILCPMHGARFDIESGVCTMGPCLDDGLEKFRVEVKGDVAEIHRASSFGIAF